MFLLSTLIFVQHLMTHCQTGHEISWLILCREIPSVVLVGRLTCVQTFMPLSEMVLEISWFKVCIFKRLLVRPLVANRCNFWFIGSCLHSLKCADFHSQDNPKKGSGRTWLNSLEICN